ncbi:hypothetical protein M5K25_025621 [Dendrobium thyrsiflorum]|uniref:Uncharacterized protein n=1 Tax=Dendrobium thyrsiflorum TaxID=117978 RepID=A0ABD0U4K3_DENTH
MELKNTLSLIIAAAKSNPGDDICCEIVKLFVNFYFKCRLAFVFFVPFAYHPQSAGYHYRYPFL